METWNVPVDLIPPSMLIEFLNGMSGLAATPERVRLVIEAHQLLRSMNDLYRLKISVDSDGTMYIEVDPRNSRY